MKAPLFAVGLLLLACTATAAPSLPSPDDPQALVSWFTELGPRREGSVAERRVFSALTTWFGERVPLESSDFSAMEGEHSFSKRLWFRVEGSKPGELVIVAPTDGGNHRGLAWAVAWADDAIERGTPVSLVFLFTGGERGTGDGEGLGSRAFLQDYYPTVPSAVLYLDSDGRANRVEMTAESGLFPSPLWMVRGLTEAFQSHGLDPNFTGTAPSLFRLDLPERRNALAPWFDRQLPALWIGQGPASVAVVRSLEDFVGSLADGVPSHWDRHYLVFDFGFWKTFWSQQTYIVVFLVVVAVLVFGYALAGRHRRGSLRVLGSGFWQIPVLFAFLFLALYAGTLLASALQETRGMPLFWKTSPLLVWSFKAMVAVSLYLFLFLPFRRSPLSRDPDFYGQAALVWLGLLVMVSAAMELSFSFYFLWALVWGAVLLVAPWRPLQFLALVAGPVWLIKAAWDVLGPEPDLALTHWALGSPVAGNVALAVLFFPFLLQVNAWHFAARSRQTRDEGLRAAAQLVLFAVATLFVGAAVLRVPAPSSEAINPAPVLVNLVKTPRPDLWKTTVTRSAFLDRTVWNLEFRGEVAPEQIEFTLVSDDRLTIFDCSFPVTLGAEGNEARILVGRQPTLPLSLRVTLPKTTKAQLLVTVGLAGEHPMDLTDTVELRP